MPSDIATKIAAAWFDRPYRKGDVEKELAVMLDAFGVGEAFAACKCVAEDVWPNKTAKKALKKVGMV